MGTIKLIEYNHVIPHLKKIVPIHMVESILTNENMDDINTLKNKILEYYKDVELTMDSIKSLKIVLKFILQNY